MYQKLSKPFFDFFFALIFGLVISPLVLLVGFLLAIHLKGNPFFFQRRPGKNERVFTLIKFRTMRNMTDASGKLLSDAQRLTKFGKWVRSTSLDELPQVINILKGEMSWVGPRPLLPEYLPLYNDFQGQRHEVRPGITGWAQVNGRNQISWNDKFELDVFYVKRISFALDCKILLKTLQKVVTRSDISQKGNVTMPPFKGN